MPCPIIGDGYTFTKKLEPIAHWQAPTIRYRPALAEDTLEYLYQRDLVQGRAQMKPMVEFIGKHLAGWDVRDKDGNVLPHTPDNLRRLHIGFLNQILDHVMGYAQAEAEQDAKNSAGASGS